MHLGTDLRFAWRVLQRNPGFSVIGILTLAFGIAVNTAIFSVFDGILLRPLGYGDESRLVTIHEVVPKFGQPAPRLPVNAMHFFEWRKSVRAFERIAMIGEITLNLTGAGEPERITAARVSASLFPMLGARTQLGRTFLDDEDQPGRDNVVVLSNGLWKRRFAGDPGVVGHTISLDGHPYEVVGVLSSSFHFPKLSQLYAMTITAERPELWKPFAVRPDELEPLGDFNFACIARLRPDIALRPALEELNATQGRLASLAPEKIDLSAALVPLHDQITGRSRTGLELVMSAVALVLLTGCVNIANLLLARASSRKREMAIRSALGAGSWRLLRQLLVENLLLAGIGGALGIAMAGGVLRLILARAPADLPRLDDVHLDGRALLFTLAASVFAGLFFGILPSWRLSRLEPQEGMQSGNRASTKAPGAGRLRSALVTVEVGLSTVCLITGGLLLRSFANLLQSDKGFTAQQVFTVNLNLPDARYPDLPQRVRFIRSLLESLRALPGVQSAGVSNMLPLSGEGGNNLITVEGTTVPFTERPLADIRGVDPEYFATLGIPLRQGEIFRDTDRDRKVATVSALTAARLWPGQDPVGKRFKVGDPEGPFIDVVGVVGDVRSVGLDKPPSMTIYLPYWQRPTWRGPAFAIRTASVSLDFSWEVRHTIHRLDAELAVPRFQTMEQVVDQSVAQRRFQMTLILLFALAALVLAGLGIYGVVSHSVASRTREMGIRMALGAHRADILSMMLGRALAPVAVGLCAGLVAALAVGRLLAGLLYGVKPLDTVTISSVLLTLTAVATVAALIPARRATLVDPATVLRYE